MLDKYRESQKDFCNIIDNLIIKNNKVSHAYFIETSFFSDSDSLVIEFAKLLLSYDKTIEEQKNISSLIDNGVYNDLYIIEPDGSLIKKEQILKLKEELSNTSINNSKRVYIIKNADKLNSSSGNSILKFLEEPEDNIIGILVADNRYNVIDTLLSRCQILKLKSDNYIFNEEEYSDMFDFIMNIEKNKVKTLCYIGELWGNKYSKREDVVSNFEKIRNIYTEALQYKIMNKTKYVENLEDLKYISNNNTNDELIRKINVVNALFKDLDYNANVALLLDRFIIDISGGMSNEKNS